MRAYGSRITLAAFSALAAAAVFPAPAEATVFNQAVSVQSKASIGKDGTITLSGTYRCELPSPKGAIHVGATLVQDGVRLGLSAGAAVCDGRSHAWYARGTLRYTPGVHAGRAEAAAELQEIHFSGFMPSSLDTVAADRKVVEVVDLR
ncbi:hypothetical protein HYE82_15895 [Streptomyces sp. BR123]|uniref:DUF6299 family protein n=1 Tax=Streptomyces sp. BR123 TaxID=2749828 RepID=UPI0015C441BE|nr:DUF6299 family protein [Streptomyces sp. BR123]NXY95847.1 hypothetical protein [Streptomyces sp. BR123]